MYARSLCTTETGKHRDSSTASLNAALCMLAVFYYHDRTVARIGTHVWNGGTSVSIL